MGLSDVARFDGWAAPDAEWSKSKGGNDMDVPTLPDPDPFILQVGTSGPPTLSVPAVFCHPLHPHLWCLIHGSRGVDSCRWPLTLHHAMSLSCFSVS